MFRTIGYVLATALLVSLAVCGLFYGIIAEVELRELRADRTRYNMILCERALAERHARLAAQEPLNR